MGIDKSLYVSVIITAYNRKEFLLNAIKSVTNQTLNKKYYEIIVIKNYNDDIIDDFINKNNIKNILMDGTVGEFLYKGIKESDGNIISFLDDDDLFTDNKLEIIYNKFKNTNIAYYHNGNIPINKSGKNITVNRVDDVVFNLSSISIRKIVINIDKIKNIFTNPDDFMYLSALESGKKIIKSKKKLTYYRIHNSASNIIVKNFDEYKKWNLEYLNINIESLTLLNKIFNSKRCMSFFNARFTDYKLWNFIYGIDENPDNLMNYFISNLYSIRHKTLMLLIFIIVKHFPSFKKYVFKKIWINYKQSIAM